ncbi:hypothetical protein D7Z26_11370 [Cohnella endophytica]|uniref:Cell wall-active antibiotics response protein n=1 Tax=Cohnella endophytica TaxID=2419778 RepID=A0A494Y0W0_9BACL|nr:cell wall-active antibiotics response protein LiaF [Cohnella endophytica]RKP53982.1 hypothetical protein D7Z26_11370 [Cohnella endophytica]
MHSSIVHRMLWGTLIVAVGVIYLCNQLGITDLSIGEIFSTYWPIILIVVGLQGLLLQHKGGVCWNGITIAAGFYFLGRNLMWFHKDLSDVVRMIAPVAIIIFGICFILRGNGRSGRRRRRERNRERWNPIVPPVPPSPSGPPPAPPEWDEFERPKQPKISLDKTFSQQPNNSDFVDRKSNEGHDRHHDRHGWWNDRDWNHSDRDNHSRFIGDAHFGSDYWELRPMNISHFIGDTTLDLTKAQIPFGETKINISSFIGDVKVYVPNDIGIGIRVISSCLIGDVKVLEEKRGGLFNQMSVSTPGYADSDKRVVLVVSSLIGDVRVTKVG